MRSKQPEAALCVDPVVLYAALLLQTRTVEQLTQDRTREYFITHMIQEGNGTPD